MVQRTSLAPRGSSRYGLGMSPANLSPADALLRLWMLAEIAMAGVYGWLGWRMRDWPGDLPAPQPLQAVEISEFMILFVVVPAAVVVALRWRVTRDRPLAALALAYGGLTLWSFIAWDSAFEDGAALSGEVLRLRFADAAIALAGVPVAIRALRLG
ncbi:MAG: hypothetical protein B7Y35_05660 [Sphingomonadales bacterium 28-64-96]|nr:MAG: hypothetical protein B7Y35_05660 [Sphingomonadales bacterium 28-64-96]